MVLLAWMTASSSLSAAPPDKADHHQAAVAKQPEPKQPEAKQPDAELLALYGMDATRLAEFHDGRPLAEDEQDPLLRMLVAVRRFTLGDLHEWQHFGLPDEAVLKETGDYRGRIYRFQGRVKRVQRIPLPAELADRFQLQRYYRCELVADATPKSAGRPVVVFALHVPLAWQPGAPLDKRAAAVGFLIKRAAAAQPAAAATPVFAAGRVEYFPYDLLGNLGMDVGLLDDVQDRKPIESSDRACFYALLAAVKRSQPGALLRQAAAHDPIAPLFNEPTDQRGRLVGITGTAIRAIPIAVEDPEMLAVFGIERYYEVEVVNADSQGNALVFCVLELPPGMPTGERIAVDVRAAGFYFKSWAYHPHPLANKGLPAGEVKFRLSPLIIGRELALLPKPAAGSSLINGISIGLLVAAMVGFVAFGWWFWREDRRFRNRQTLSAPDEPISLPPAGPVSEREE
jgi:hypothetical protein